MNKLTLVQTRGNVELNNYPVEDVSNSVVTLLYNIGIDDDLNRTLTEGVDTSSVKRPITSVLGSISVQAAYSNLLEYLQDKCPNLKIVSRTEYIWFEDPEIRRILLNNVTHAGEGITATECLAVKSMKNWFKDNLNIVTFNEFSYFRPTSSTEDMFSGSSIRSINFSNLTKVSSSFCADSSLEGDISIPNLSGVVGTYAFRNCSGITSVSDLGAVTKIEHNAFENCISLQSVTIPSSCIDISYRVFQGCTSLLEVIGFDNILSLNESAFDGVTGLANGLKDSQGNLLGSYTYNSGNANQTSLGGFNFPNLKTLNINALKGIGLYGYINLPQCTKLSGFGSNPLITYVNAPNAYFQSQNGDAFNGCTGLTGITLASQLTIIPYNTFKNCSNLTTLDMLGGDLSTVDYFGDHCFSGCSSFSIYASDVINATTIDSYAFEYGVYKSATLQLPNLTSLYRNAFQNNLSLLSVVIGDALHKNCSTISQEVFYNCNNITSIDLSNTIITLVRARCVYTLEYTGLLLTVLLPTTLTLYGEYFTSEPFRFKLGVPVTIRGLDNVTTIWAGITALIQNPIYLKYFETGQRCIICTYENKNSFCKQLYMPSFKYSNISSISVTPNSTVLSITFFSYKTKDTLYNTSFELLYFKDLEKIQLMMFYGCRPKRLVINNATPPTVDTLPQLENNCANVPDWATWSTTIFGVIPAASSAGASDGMTIYVPDSAISTYQADANYNAYPIVGISSLTQYATEADWITNGSPVDGLITEYMT